jgi:hypothetical protein
MIGCGVGPAASRSSPVPKKGSVNYDWLELTVSDDGKHVYRAEIDREALSRRNNLSVEVKAGDQWIEVLTATKESIQSALGKNARLRPIEGEKLRELYHGADNELVFLGGSFAFKGKVLRIVALLDGSELRIGGEGGDVIHLECERSLIEEILGEPLKMKLPESANSNAP